jgi:hypothetical protein
LSNNVEVTESASFNVRDKTALEIVNTISEFCEAHGPIARHMWRIQSLDAGTVKLTRRFTRELKENG